MIEQAAMNETATVNAPKKRDRYSYKNPITHNREILRKCPVIRIQKLVRGHLGRIKFKLHKRELRDEAVLKRTETDRGKVHYDFEQHGAAILIQRWFRNNPRLYKVKWRAKFAKMLGKKHVDKLLCTALKKSYFGYTAAMKPKRKKKKNGTDAEASESENESKPDSLAAAFTDNDASSVDGNSIDKSASPTKAKGKGKGKKGNKKDKDEGEGEEEGKDDKKTATTKTKKKKKNDDLKSKKKLTDQEPPSPKPPVRPVSSQSEKAPKTRIQTTRRKPFTVPLVPPNYMANERFRLLHAICLQRIVRGFVGRRRAADFSTRRASIIATRINAVTLIQKTMRRTLVRIKYSDKVATVGQRTILLRKKKEKWVTEQHHKAIAAAVAATVAATKVSATSKVAEVTTAVVTGTSGTASPSSPRPPLEAPSPLEGINMERREALLFPTISLGNLKFLESLDTKMKPFQRAYRRYRAMQRFRAMFRNTHIIHIYRIQRWYLGWKYRRAQKTFVSKVQPFWRRQIQSYFLNRNAARRIELWWFKVVEGRRYKKLFQLRQECRRKLGHWAKSIVIRRLYANEVRHTR